MLRVTLSAARRRGDLDAYQEASHAALGQIDTEIANLRALVTELRPAALDDLGTDAALRALADRLSRMDFSLDLHIDLDYEQGRAPTRHVPELEAAVYRIVQEAAQNSFKHSGVREARIHLSEHAGVVDLLIEDAGSGFDSSASHDGFGLVGIRERVELLNGTLAVHSSGEGTSLQVSLPVRRREIP